MTGLYNIFKVPLLFLFLLSGCSQKADYKQDKDATTQIHHIKQSLPSGLDLLEELYDNMDYDAVINKYSDKVPFSATVTRFRYYVIFSDLDENTTYNLIDKDIRQTVDAMTGHYVSVLPDRVTPVFYFKDYETYRDFSVNTLGIAEHNLSQYGYLKISKNLIAIRYVSWKGSTSHEITHSLTRYDFSEIPSWFDEGLASLHEKYIYKDGEMRAEFSWRILAIRRACRENTYTALRDLMETDDEELYGSRSPFYYAQSRYLLMYLQQKDLLDDYYKLFRDTYYEDNTGIVQLEKTTNKSLTEIDKELIEYLNSFAQQW